MIAEKIAQAKKAKQKKQINLLAVSGGAVIMVALLLYLVTNFKLARDESATQSKLTQQKQPVLDTKPKEMADSEQFDRGAGLQYLPSNEARQNSVADRQVYLEAYQHYQTALKPSLNSIDLMRWDKPVSDKLQLFENAALEQFSSGNYASALDAINKLTELAKDTIERSQNEYDDAIARAKQAYSALDYNMALLAIDKATLHQKDSQELGSLSLQIENIATIRDLEQIIRIANIESDPETELQAIRSLAKVDPDWGDYSQRTATLASQITIDRFNRAIARAYAAVDKKQVNTARAELNKASAISSSREEINQLSQEIAQLERTKRLETSVTNADTAAASDDWDKVSRNLAQALNNKPNDRLLTSRLEKANQIIAFKKQMTVLLTHPYRLATESVKVRAKIALIKAESYTEDSASLSTLSAKLADTVEAVNREVVVTLVSDGVTSISVRGVGIVGAVTSKVIQLKPGPYTFEGKRKGYKSKIVTVTIPMNNTTFRLKVVANERI